MHRSDLATAAPPPPPPPPRLTILCLHGFRANSSTFKGRLRALQRKLSGVATLVFLDAPHVLPLWWKPTSSDSVSTPPEHPTNESLPRPKRAWLLSADQLAAQPELQALFSQPSSTAAHQPQQHQQPHYEGQQLPGAWQVAPDNVANPQQYRTQDCGWDQSWEVIRAALARGSTQQQGRIDGLLGFSQGAAVAAVVAALCQQQQQQQQQPGPEQLKFVMLASGFVSPAAEHAALLQQQAPIQLPSLHMYAAADDDCTGTGSSSSRDRQIQQRLLELFDAGSRRVLRHAAGHMVPSDSDSIAQIKGFLQQFL